MTAKTRWRVGDSVRVQNWQGLDFFDTVTEVKDGAYAIRADDPAVVQQFGGRLVEVPDEKVAYKKFQVDDYVSVEDDENNVYYFGHVGGVKEGAYVIETNQAEVAQKFGTYQVEVPAEKVMDC